MTSLWISSLKKKLTTYVLKKAVSRSHPRKKIVARRLNIFRGRGIVNVFSLQN
jgi:hypothetical protein